MASPPRLRSATPRSLACSPARLPPRRPLALTPPCALRGSGPREGGPTRPQEAVSPEEPAPEPPRAVPAAAAAAPAGPVPARQQRQEGKLKRKAGLR
eukprot:SM000169S02708  [mRNA]  locus=s169:41828:42329:- [translate_table: standard]